MPYSLLAQGSPTDIYSFTLGGPVPPGLPFTPLPPGITAATPTATDLQNGVIPAGFQVLQLLNAEGSTQTVLGAKLDILNGFSSFAINMQDTADGTLTETEEEDLTSAAVAIHELSVCPVIVISNIQRKNVVTQVT